MNRFMPILLLASLLCVTACGSETDPTESSASIANASPADDLSANDGDSATALDVISDPSHDRMTQTAPAEFDALFHTSAGDFVIRVKRDWAPVGADRFYNLVVNKFYDQNRFFRIASGQGGSRFVAQWGIHGEPSVNRAWQRSKDAKIMDDPVIQSNTRGRLTFATSGPNSRTAQLFISYSDNEFLDAMGFSAFGEVIDDGMETVDAINGEYGARPDQGQIQSEGNAYLKKKFPNLDYIISATIIELDS